MKKYLDQLLSDIRAAYRASEKSPKSVEDDPDGQKLFDEAEAFLEFDQDAAPFFKQHCGLQVDQFPPFESLEEGQANTIIKAYNGLLKSWNILFEPPKDLPPSEVYRLTIGLLDQQIMIVEEGNIGFEYCDSDSNNCVYGDHCPCLEWEAKVDADEKAAQEWLDAFELAINAFENDGQKLSYSINDSVSKELSVFSDFMVNGINTIPDNIFVRLHMDRDILDRFIAIINPADPLYRHFVSKDIWLIRASLEKLMQLKCIKTKKNHFVFEPFHFNVESLIQGGRKIDQTKSVLDELINDFHAGGSTDN